MDTLRLMRAYLKVNVQLALAYRAEALVNILLNLFWLGWELLSLSIIFSNTPTLGGWGPGELIALLGVFRLVNAMMAAVIWPNTEKFNTAIRDGSWDYTLLKPVSSLFLVTFTNLVIWRVWDLALAGVLIGVGLHLSSGAASLGSVAVFAVLVASGMLIIYSLWIVLIALTFWFVKFDNNVTILQALLEAGRYPATVYPFWLRMIVTFVVPVAVATTVPLQALRGELSPGSVLLSLAVGVAAFGIAIRVWQAGTRQYGGASS